MHSLCYHHLLQCFLIKCLQMHTFPRHHHLRHTTILRLLHCHTQNQLPTNLLQCHQAALHLFLLECQLQQVHHKVSIHMGRMDTSQAWVTASNTPVCPSMRIPALYHQLVSLFSPQVKNPKTSHFSSNLLMCSLSSFHNKDHTPHLSSSLIPSSCLICLSQSRCLCHSVSTMTWQKASPHSHCPSRYLNFHSRIGLRTTFRVRLVWAPHRCP